MSLWVDKYRPTSLKELSFHPEITSLLSDLASSNDIPHLLVYGPSGAGKMTRVRILLQELYDSSINKIKYEEKVFLTPSGKKVDVVLFSSNFHIEITPSDVGIYDRVVVQEMIKELAQTQQIDKSKKPFKVAVINDADRLSKDAQHALRRTMEKFSSNIRFVLCCSSIGRIIPPIKSRCLLIRVPSPSDSSVKESLNSVCRCEGLKIGEHVLTDIVSTSNGNARKAVLALEAASINDGLHQKDWSNVLNGVVSSVMKEQSPANLLKIRTTFYELLNHCIPASLIVKTLTMNFLEQCDPLLVQEISSICAEYDHRLSKGSKAIFHLEALVAKVMCCLAKTK